MMERRSSASLDGRPRSARTASCDPSVLGRGLRQGVDVDAHATERLSTREGGPLGEGDVQDARAHQCRERYIRVRRMSRSRRASRARTRPAFGTPTFGAVVRGHLSLLGVAVSVVCLAGVVYWAAHQPAPQFPDRGSEWLALAGAIALYAVATAVRSERWHLLLREDGASPTRADAYSLTVIGYTGNNVLPARAGDAVRVVLMAPRAATSRRTVVGTLLAERLLDVGWIVVLFLVVGYGILGEVGATQLQVVAAATAGLAVAAIVAVLLLRRNPRLRGHVRPMLTSTMAIRGRHGAILVAVTGGIWLLETAVWMSAGAAAGLDMSPLEGLYLVALASVFSMIPSGPAYAGTQDTAAVVGIKAIGGTSSLAVSYLLILRFVLQVPVTLAGFALLAARYGGIGKLRRVRLEDGAADPATPR